MPVTFEDINTWIEQGELERAAAVLDPALAREPGHGIASFYRGMIDMHHNDNIAAAARFEAAVKAMPTTPAAHFNLGVALKRLSQSNEAAEAFMHALITDPSGAGASSLLGLVRIDLGHRRDAQGPAKWATVLEPLSADYLGNAGFSAWRNGDLKTAETYLRAALDQDPDNATNRLNLANVLKEKGQEEDAVGIYRDALATDPNAPHALNNLAVALLEGDQLPEAATHFARLARITHGCPFNDIAGYDDLPSAPRRPVNRLCARHRLKHDMEQYRYLAERDLLPSDLKDQWQRYGDVLDGLTAAQRDAISFTLDDHQYGQIGATYNRLIRWEHTGWDPDRPAVSDAVNWRQMEDAFLDGDPQAVAIDGLLSEGALTTLRRFCLNSTFWFEVKGAGYLGAYFKAGFNDPLLLRIARDFREKFSRALTPHPLRMMWGYKYDQDMVGINPHADFAAVNVNFWITPDEANLDKETGGLLVYKKPPPEGWDFERYNGAPATEVYAALGDTAKHPLRIANRENRGLLFDSRLFHETDRASFAPGYENRRINITMLFGDGFPGSG